MNGPVIQLTPSDDGHPGSRPIWSISRSDEVTENDSAHIVSSAGKRYLLMIRCCCCRNGVDVDQNLTVKLLTGVRWVSDTHLTPYLPASRSFQFMIALNPNPNVPWVCHRQNGRMANKIT